MILKYFFSVCHYLYCPSQLISRVSFSHWEYVSRVFLVYSANFMGPSLFFSSVVSLFVKDVMHLKEINKSQKRRKTLKWISGQYVCTGFVHLYILLSSVELSSHGSTRHTINSMVEAYSSQQQVLSHAVSEEFSGIDQNQDKSFY